MKKTLLEQPAVIKGNILNIAFSLFVFLTLSFAAVVFNAEDASANGAIGDSGDSTSPPTGTGASTTYGWGWYKYDLSDDEEPAQIRDGTKVKYVLDSCSDNTHLFAFIILNKNNGSPKTDGVVYRYNDSKGVYFNPTLNGYRGNDGGSWQTVGDAKTAFAKTKSELGDAAKSFEFGKNVAWFCWNGDQKWNTKGSVSINRKTATFGQKVEWTHEVRTTKGSQTDTDKSIESWTLNSSGGKVSEDTTGKGIKPDKRVRQFKSSFTVKQNHIGNQYCRATIWSPRSWKSEKDRKTEEVCVDVTYSYTMKPQTLIAQDASQPKEVLKFNYSVENRGPTKTDNKNITYTSRIRRVSNSQTNPPTVEQVGAGTALKTGYSGVVVPPGTMPGFVINKAGADVQGAYPITQNDVNHWICSRISINRTSQSNSDNVYDIACKFIPYNYTLTPRAPGELPNSGEAGSTIPSVRGDIYNNGPTKSKNDTIWQLTGFVLRGSRSHNGGNSATAPCGTNGNYNGQYYNSGTASSCRSLDRGNGSISSEGTVSLNANNVVIPNNLEVGDSYCFAVSVRDRSHSPGTTPWAHSAARCFVISKKPKVNVTGGDLWVRGATSGDSIVSTSTSTNDAGKFGSLVEYALAARGSVTGMGSAAGYQGRVAASTTLCNVSYLTFGNVVGNNNSCSEQQGVGNFTRLPSTPNNISGRFTTSGSTLNGTVELDRSGTFGVSGNRLTISESDIARGQSTIIVAPGADVVINGNIEYFDGEMSSAGEIPQVVIIARNIFINERVTRLDAWLVANDATGGNGYINTCRTNGASEKVMTGIHSDNCNDTLTVNGPVMAKELLMRRTAGAGSRGAAGEPAEIFNLRPDAYLWMANRISSGAGLPTTATRELPPKY